MPWRVRSRNTPRTITELAPLSARSARARAGERIMAISGYQRAAAALLVGTEPNFVTWGDYGPENRTSPRAPTPRSLHSAARCARRTALERASSCCTFAKNKRQSRVQLTQHAARKPRMRCWGYCGRSNDMFGAGLPRSNDTRLNASKRRAKIRVARLCRALQPCPSSQTRHLRGRRESCQPKASFPRSPRGRSRRERLPCRCTV